MKVIIKAINSNGIESTLFRWDVSADYMVRIAEFADRLIENCKHMNYHEEEDGNIGGFAKFVKICDDCNEIIREED